VLDPQGPYALFTDGSAYYKDGSGGWAYVIIDRFGNEEIGSGYVSDTTNNRMEMQAWIEGLNHLVETLGPCSVLVYSDSQYVGNGALRLYPSPDMGRSKNQDLWIEIDEAIDQHQSVEFVWVKGHHESRYNQLVDELAGNARRNGIQEI
jgi:ribonuclease HI